MKQRVQEDFTHSNSTIIVNVLTVITRTMNVSFNVFINYLLEFSARTKKSDFCLLVRVIREIMTAQ